MKVLFTFGGLPHYYNSILNRLNDIEGIEIVVAIPASKSSTLGAGVFESTKDIRFKVIHLNEGRSLYGKPILKNFLRTVKAEQPDIVITIWPYVLSFVFSPFLFLYFKLKRIKILYKEIPFLVPKYQDAVHYYRDPIIASMNEDMIEIRESGFISTLKFRGLAVLRKYIYTRIVDATVNYIDEAKEIISSYGADVSKIFVTTNSPDTDLLLSHFYELNITNVPKMQNPHRLIHVGRLVKWKRVDLLLSAVAVLQKKYPDIEMHIIGTGPEEVSLKQQTRELGLENNVVFLGGVYDNATLGSHLLSSSIYVLAGMGGLSINEAMCFAKPVICSICDGTEKRLVREGYNGLYFENGNHESLAEKIDYLFSRPELMRSMGENSLKIIQQDVNIHTVIRSYVDAFNYATEQRFALTYTPHN